MFVCYLIYLLTIKDHYNIIIHHYYSLLLRAETPKKFKKNREIDCLFKMLHYLFSFIQHDKFIIEQILH